MNTEYKWIWDDEVAVRIVGAKPEKGLPIFVDIQKQGGTYKVSWASYGAVDAAFAGEMVQILTMAISVADMLNAQLPDQRAAMIKDIKRKALEKRQAELMKAKANGDDCDTALEYVREALEKL